MTAKILPLVHSCEGCSNRKYYSGGQDTCTLVDQIIPDKKIVASFCPLADFPSQRLADMDTTIRALREPNKYAVVHAVMSHLATKLKTFIDERYGVRVLLKDEQVVYIHPEYITKLEMFPGATVYFVYETKKFKLYPDTHPPQLFEAVIRDGVEGVFWAEHTMSQ